MCDLPIRVRERFSAKERHILFQLVEKRAAIFECKRTDVVSACKRQEAWNALCDEFNSYADVNKRTAQQLRKCWMNEKARRKKELDGGSLLLKTLQTGSQLQTTFTRIEHFLDAVNCDMLPPTVVIEEPVSAVGDAASPLTTADCTQLVCPVIAEANAEHFYAGTVSCPAPVSSIPHSSEVKCSLLPVSAASDGTRDAAVEKELKKRPQRLQRIAAQEDELRALHVKEQRYRTEMARLEYENLEKKYRRDEELHAVVLEEAKLRVELLKKQLHGGKHS